MEVFFLTLKQMLNMFALILTGFFLRKKSLLPENANTVMAKLETLIFVPALSLYTQMTKCTVENFKQNYSLILYGAIILTIALFASYPISKCFVGKSKDPKTLYQRSIYKYSMTFGNFGFMGNFIVLGVWGSDMFFKYSLFTFLASILCNSWGLYVLIPKDQNVNMWQNLKKGLLTPPIIAIVIGIILGLTSLSKFVPDFIVTALDNASKCQGPVAMLLAGFVIGGYDIKKLFKNTKVYVATFLRLIVIPSIILTVLHLLGVSDDIKIPALVAFATPLGLNTIVFPAAYGGDTTTGASMAMISNALCVVTIPLMYLIFIVLL